MSARKIVIDAEVGLLGFKAALGHAGHRVSTGHYCPMGFHVLNDSLDDTELAMMMINSRSATEFLKALGHEGRLMILCHLATKERSVTELEQLLSQRQAAVSQQLARLRLERLVESRRDGKTIYYSLADGRVRQMVEIIYDMFCAEAPERQ